MWFCKYSLLQERHPLLDITPTAVERLSYIQYHPIVLFLEPHSRKDVKVMRQRYDPNSKKSSRKLYSHALKLKKQYSHLFAGKRYFFTHAHLLACLLEQWFIIIYRSIEPGKPLYCKINSTSSLSTHAATQQVAPQHCTLSKYQAHYVNMFNNNLPVYWSSRYFCF